MLLPARRSRDGAVNGSQLGEQIKQPQASETQMYVIPLKLYSNVSDTTTNVVNVVGACIDLPTVTDRIQADARSRSRRRSPSQPPLVALIGCYFSLSASNTFYL